MKRRLTRSCALLCVLFWARAAASQPPVVRIAPHDTVTVTVEGQPGLSGQYSVEVDGSLVFPLIGRIDAAGLTADALSDMLARRLDAYIKGPLVRVAIGRPGRVFVFGDVKKPGVYDLTRGMTILELLVQAQYSGVSEVLIVRARDASVPVLPQQTSPSDVIRVNLRNLEKDLETGDLSRNLLLESGDTVFVPQIDPHAVHVAGEVRNPGSYSVPDGTTVRQALTLAGGATTRASLRRLRIVRIMGDDQGEHKPEIDDPVRPGDTIVVPGSFSFPSPGLTTIGLASCPACSRSESFSFPVRGLPGAGDGESPDRPRGQFRPGSVLTLTPSLTLTQFGVDTNVFNTLHDRKAAFVMELSPGFQAALDLRRVRLEGSGDVGLEYYHPFTSESGVNPAHSVSATVALAKGLVLAVSHDGRTGKDRFNAQFDPRVRRNERQLTADVRFGPWRRVRFNVSASDWKMRFGEEVGTLNEHRRDLAVTGILALSPLSSVFVSATAATRRFPLFPARDADSTQLMLGASFKRSAVMEGRAEVGFLRYTPFDVTVRPAGIVSPRGMLWHTWRDRAQLGVRGARSISNSFQQSSAYAIDVGYGGWIQMVLPPRFDIVAETYHDEFNYRAFGSATDPSRAHPPLGQTIRYTSQFGVRVKSGRVALEVTYLQRLGAQESNPFAQNYSGWRTNVTYDFAYRFFEVRRNTGTSIRGKDGFTNY